MSTPPPWVVVRVSSGVVGQGKDESTSVDWSIIDEIINPQLMTRMAVHLDSSYSDSCRRLSSF